MTLAGQPDIIRRICAALRAAADRQWMPKCFYLTDEDRAELVQAVPAVTDRSAIGGVPIRKGASSRLYCVNGVHVTVPRKPPP